MFVPKIAKAQTKAAEHSSGTLVPQRSTVAGHRFGHDPVELALFLQRTIGNQAALRLFARDTSRQAVSDPPSDYEQEVSATKNSMTLHAASRDPELSIVPGRTQLSRKCAACEEEGKENLQMKPAELARPVANEAPPIVHEALRSPGEPLEPATRSYFEPRFGHDFSKVRVHTDAKAAESAQAVNALAYTVGHDIVFANRPSGPSAGDGARILAHELTHVLQQSGGSGDLAGLRVGSIDSRSEREADEVASAVLSNRQGAPTIHARTPALQRQTLKTPAQTPGQTQADPVWGSKKWAPFEDDWNAFYQLAIQGLAGGSLKPEQLPKLAALTADDAMVFCLKHGSELRCAKAAAQDQGTKSDLDITLPWGSTGTWGQTFRSALQSTTSNVNGPITAGQAVQKAGDIADQAARGMLSNSAWQLYMNCKTPNASSSTSPPQKTATSGAH